MVLTARGYTFILIACGFSVRQILTGAELSYSPPGRI